MNLIVCKVVPDVQFRMNPNKLENCEEGVTDCGYDFTFLEKVQSFIKILSKSIYDASKQHFYIGHVTIVLPSNWIPPEGEESEKYNFNGTISSINFDEVPLRIYPDKVKQCYQ